jgi:hypothetical protein
MNPYIDRTACFFAKWAAVTPCDGALVRGHLIPQQVLKREFPKGAWRDGDKWIRHLPEEAQGDTETERGWSHLTVEQLIDDERSWVPMCGGLMGLSGHHGQLDWSRKLRIPRELIPVGTEEFAIELDLLWWLDRTYGPRLQEAA